MRSISMAAVALFLLLAAPEACSQIATFSHAIALPATPMSVLRHSNGDVWIGMSGQLARYSLDGTSLGAVGTFTSLGLAEDPNGDVWASDYTNNRVVHFGPTGALLGSFTPSAMATVDVAIDETGGVYALVWPFPPASDLAEVRLYSRGGTLISRSGLATALGLAYGDGVVYAVEAQGGALRRYTRDLSPAGVLVSGANFAEQVSRGDDGVLDVADYGAGTVRALAPDGTLVGTLGPAVPGYGTMKPCDVWAGGGMFLVTDCSHASVLVFVEAPTRARAHTWGRLKAAYR